MGSQAFSFQAIPPLYSVGLQAVCSLVISQLLRDCFGVQIFAC
jgi:hypothetical protein